MVSLLRSVSAWETRAPSSAFSRKSSTWPQRLRQPHRPEVCAMSKTAITSPEIAPPVGPFSQAVKIDGFLFFSGHVAQDPATGRVVEGGIVAETERVFQN